MPAFWRTHWKTWAAIVGGAIILVPIAAAEYMGSLSRYLADDFCTLGSLRDLGFWGSQVYWYTTWSGRFAFTFTVNIFEALGAWMVPLLPAAHLLGLLVGARWAFARWLARSEDRGSRWAVWFIGGLVVYETISSAPNLYQSLYWQTGVLTYVAPLVMASFYAGWILGWREGGEVGAGSLLISALAMAVAVGYSETVGSMLVAALAGACLLLWLLAEAGTARTSALRLVGAGLLGGILGMLVVAAAPGNAARQALLTPSSSAVFWFKETTRNAYIFSVRTLRGDPLRLALGLALPFLLGGASAPRTKASPVEEASPLRRLLFLVALPPFTFGLVMACMAPTQYAMASYPDGRLLISAQFAVATGMALWGAAAGRWLMGYWPAATGRWPQAGMAVVCVLALVTLGFDSFGATRQLLAPLPDARDFAARSDERLTKVLEAHQAGIESLPVASLTHMGGLDEISSDSANWVNVCFAQAYGLKRVTAK